MSLAVQFAALLAGLVVFGGIVYVQYEIQKERSDLSKSGKMRCVHPGCLTEISLTRSGLCRDHRAKCKRCEKVLMKAKTFCEPCAEIVRGVEYRRERALHAVWRG